MSLFDKQFLSEVQLLTTHQDGSTVWLKREDKIHPDVSGNKFRKLKYNLAFAKAKKIKTLITFGGAYSNHIPATAKAGELEGFKTIGIIRGEELNNNFKKTLATNKTLQFAYQCGMRFLFINRSLYRDKNDANTFQIILDLLKGQNLLDTTNEFYVIPEGGTNSLAIKGCREILTESDDKFDYICAAVGTGGTLAGLIESSSPHQKVLGFPALKGDFLNEEIANYTAKNNWQLITEYHFGGYAKYNIELINFINAFKKKHTIALDPIYTGKLLYGIYALLNQGFFSKNTRILAVHTGGLQGISAFNTKLVKAGQPVLI